MGRNGSYRRRGVQWISLAMLVVVTSCPGPVPEPEGLGPDVDLKSLTVGGLTLRYPSGARILESATVNCRVATVLGPLVSIRPVDQEWSWSGASYALEIRTFPNPDRPDAERWARAWLGDPERNGEPIGSTPIGARPAFRVATFGGDSKWVHLFVSDADRMPVFTYNDAPMANNPISTVARDAVSLLLGTVHRAGLHG
jgi:hypothetical protein